MWSKLKKNKTTLEIDLFKDGESTSFCMPLPWSKYAWHFGMNGIGINYSKIPNVLYLTKGRTCIIIWGGHRDDVNAEYDK